MTRVQTLVQLSDELVAALDQHAAAVSRSRSEIIRAAIERYLAEVLETEIDRQIVQGYRRVPQEGDPMWDAALKESIAAEPW